VTLLIELAQPALEQRPGLIDCVGDSWHFRLSPLYPDNGYITVTVSVSEQ
jgi:hypothetical protein